MKIKLISLITALLCLAVLLVSCSDPCTTHLDADYDGKCDTCGDEIQTPTVNCTEHVDADNDGICDTPHCGTVIKTVIKEVEVEVPVDVEVPVPNEKETGIALVVKPIPSDANLADYFSFDYENNTIIYNTTKPDSVKWSDREDDVADRFLVFSTLDADLESKRDEGIELYWRVYTVYDLKEDKTIITYTTEKYEFTPDPDLSEAEIGEARLSFIDQITSNVIFSANTGDVIEISEYGAATHHAYYTYTGTLLVEDSDVRLRASLGDGYNYLNDGKTTVAFDPETGKILHKADNAFFVHRPSFEAYTADGKFGIDVEGNTFRFYNLESWIDLAFEYTLPSYCEWNSETVFFLANGTVLVEAMIELPETAVSYDLYMHGDKYDLVYKIIDPAKKTVTDVEFGYAIEVDVTDEFELTDKTSNVFLVYPIENQMCDFASYKLLAVDSELNILCELEALVTGANAGEYEVIADDRMLVRVEVGSTVVRYVVNAKGEIVNTLPNNARVEYGAIWVGKKAYAIDDKTYETPLVDLDEYDSYNTFSDSFIYMKKTVTTEPDPEVAGSVAVTTEYVYVWNSSMSAPKCVVSQKIENVNGLWTDLYVYDYFNHFIITNTVTVATDDGGNSHYVKTYTLFNSNGEEITKYVDVKDVYIDTYRFDEDTLYVIVVTDNDNYDTYYRFAYEAPAATPAA